MRIIISVYLLFMFLVLFTEVYTVAEFGSKRAILEIQYSLETTDLCHIILLILTF